SETLIRKTAKEIQMENPREAETPSTGATCSPPEEQAKKPSMLCFKKRKKSCKKGLAVKDACEGASEEKSRCVSTDQEEAKASDPSQSSKGTWAAIKNLARPRRRQKSSSRKKVPSDSQVQLEVDTEESCAQDLPKKRVSSGVKIPCVRFSRGRKKPSPSEVVEESEGSVQANEVMGIVNKASEEPEDLAPTDKSESFSPDVTSVQDTASAQEAVSVQGAASVQDAASVTGASTVKDTESMQDVMSVQEAASVQDAVNAQDTASVKDAVSVQDVASMQEAASVQDAVSAQDVASVKDAASVQEAVSEQETSVQEAVSDIVITITEAEDSDNTDSDQAYEPSPVLHHKKQKGNKKSNRNTDVGQKEGPEAGGGPQAEEKGLADQGHRTGEQYELLLIETASSLVKAAIQSSIEQLVNEMALEQNKHNSFL
uniref:A-kinase anchoring protein 5 n=1 Tax=Cyanoderma ruficeps TaxID=181631 RepID=A0A8C3P319_9PASS